MSDYLRPIGPNALGRTKASGNAHWPQLLGRRARDLPLWHRSMQGVLVFLIAADPTSSVATGREWLARPLLQLLHRRGLSTLRRWARRVAPWRRSHRASTSVSGIAIALVRCLACRAPARVAGSCRAVVRDVTPKIPPSMHPGGCVAGRRDGRGQRTGLGAMLGRGLPGASPARPGRAEQRRQSQRRMWVQQLVLLRSAGRRPGAMLSGSRGSAPVSCRPRSAPLERSGRCNMHVRQKHAPGPGARASRCCRW